MKTIKLGSKGQDVKVLQELLVYHGYNIVPDSNFDESTHNAVRKFQEKHFDTNNAPLYVDGIVGTNTWQSLIDSEPELKVAQLIPTDNFTTDRIKLMHPKVRIEVEMIYKEIRDRSVSIRFTQTLRSFEEQDNLYAQGRTKPGLIVTYARGGQSFHNYGLAVDFALLLADRTVSWDRNLDLDKDNLKDWDEVVFVFKHFGWSWGGDWTRLKDFPHFEKTFGLTTLELLNRKNAGRVDSEGFVSI